MEIKKTEQYAKELIKICGYLVKTQRVACMPFYIISMPL